MWLLAILVLTGCAAPPGQGGSAGEASSPKPAGPTRLVAAVHGVHSTLQSRIAAANRRPGYDVLEELVSAGLANVDGSGKLRPQLAEHVPSLENGMWRVFSDGTMETTWKIRPNARWHDGTPVTSGDILFTSAIAQDAELAGFRDSSYAYIDRVEAPDPGTVVVTWRRPFIEADALFTASGTGTVPLPRHILEPIYLASKAQLLQHPYWSEEFVGTGPYKVREWVAGASLTLQANESYVLGRPKIDELEVRFIPDANALLANVLSGEVELAMGRGLSVEQAVQVRSQWRTGTSETAPDAWVAVFPQMLNPRPAVIGDTRFRVALLHAIDRQEMVDTIQYGLVPVAYGLLNPADPDYPAVEASIVRYEHDPRRAAELIEGFGYRRGSDAMYRDSSGQALSVEIRTTGDDIQAKSILTVSDYWQRVGVEVEQVPIAQARANDREYRSLRPGFELSRYPSNPSIDGLQRYHSAFAPLPENNYTGTNKSRWMNEEMDALLDAYFATIPHPERVQLLARLVHAVSREVVPLPLFYDARVALISHRLQNVAAKKSPGATEAWNAEMWTLK
jgi:peptide/nickel transport system substrate-binding protein